ncbi:hypothetical protein LEP1GSC049_0023 [Leptospira kirschneri serovar Cynopteri str. 3522 CT]|nr:hypothetical protein LEP1GSC049_0023 [Leptospira kirschneri serovar Cynopteri str. 3522 CT]
MAQKPISEVLFLKKFNLKVNFGIQSLFSVLLEFDLKKGENCSVYILDFF